MSNATGLPWPDVKSASGGRRHLFVGHRGAGMNRPPSTDQAGTLSCGALRENTIKSFNRAAELGADFVEFDVQVTRDGHPIIFHDNLILTEDGLSSRIPDLSLEEFQSIGPSRHTLQTERKLLRRRRDGSTYVWTVDEEDFMPTLEEMFAFVHPSLGFNIEIKFPGDDPTEFDAAAEADRILTAVLPLVARCRGSRPVFFSSFVPEAVIELKKRQTEHQVFFLTVGKGSFSDERMNSVSAAVQLCKQYGLSGVVSEASALLDQSGRDARLVKDAGLLLLSYGSANDELDALRCQQYRGGDGVITDDVSKLVDKVKDIKTEELQPPFGKYCTS